MLKPTKLQPGDKIAAVSLSWGGPAKYPHRYQAGKEQLQAAFGLQVVETRHALKDPEWLKRNPQARAEDLMEAFTDPGIRGIFATIGGDDSIRLLPYLDLEVIRQNPKVFMGFSDTTIAHLVCHKAGLVSFYGPSIMTGFAENGGIFPYLTGSLQKTLFSSRPPGEIRPNSGGWTVEFLDWGDPSNQERRRALNSSQGWRFLQGRGAARGRLLGGCLEVLDWLRGAWAWPDDSAWQDAVLFLETSEEAPSPQDITRMLRCLAALGVLEKLAAILFGRPGGGVPPEEFTNYDAALLEVVAEEQGLRDLPLVSGMDFGHTDPVFILPYGVQAEVDCDQRKFSILENAVI